MESGGWKQSTSPLKTVPLAAEAFLNSKKTPTGGASGSTSWALSSAEVSQLFSLHPVRLNLEWCSLSDDAFKSLAQSIASSTSLQQLSLRGVVPPSPGAVTAVWNALLENATIESLNVSKMALTESDALYIAENVVPWNRSILEWNLEGNDQLGDDGVIAIAQAFVLAASSVQRLCFRSCGIKGRLRDVLLLLRNLTSLYQLDVASNSGYHDPPVLEVMKDVDEVLYRNCKLLHPGAAISHTALYSSDAPHEVEAPVSSPAPLAVVALTQPTAAAAAAAAAASNCSSPGMDHSQRTPTPLARRSSMIGKSKAAATTNPSTVAASGTVQRRGSMHGGMSTPERHRPANSQVAALTAAPHHHEEGNSNSQSPLAGTQPSTVDAVRHEEPSTPHVTPIRRAHQQQHVVASARRTTAAVPEVTTGYEEWQRIKEQYNGYIRAGSPSSASKRSNSPNIRALALQQPKYVLGKLIAKEKDHPSASFSHGVNNVMYIREPTPAERRRLAPWASPARGGTPSPGRGDRSTGAADSSTLSRSSCVGNSVVVLDSKSDPKHPTAIRIVDGGDVTAIHDDPRDIGYQSRRMQTGEAVARVSASFASNTARDIRFGTDPKNQLLRPAQAPPPGTYTIPGTFEQATQRARASAKAVTATGKKCFGTTGSVRSILEVQESGVPGPGFYEIP